MVSRRLPRKRRRGGRGGGKAAWPLEMMLTVVSCISEYLSRERYFKDVRNRDTPPITSHRHRDNRAGVPASAVHDHVPTTARCSMVAGKYRKRPSAILPLPSALIFAECFLLYFQHAATTNSEVPVRLGICPVVGTGCRTPSM